MLKTPKQGSVNNAQHWLDRAEEALIQAEQTSDTDTRRQMLKVVAGYLMLVMLARHAEERTRRADLLKGGGDNA